MTVTVRITKAFKAAVKPLMKKHPSLSKDLSKLEAELNKTPTLGTPLGQNAYKIRLKIASKSRGKSGGARIISLVEAVVIGELTTTEEVDRITVNLITIYDKADTASISDKELKNLIKAFREDG